jgi:hypothetical protein
LDQINSNSPPVRKYLLPQNYYGTGHVIFQGSFFYHACNTDIIIRYDLHLHKVVSYLSLRLSSQDTMEEYCRLYSDHREHVGCIDFSVDENGVWFTYRNGSRSTIYVSKLNVEDLTVQKTVIIKFNDKDENTSASENTTVEHNTTMSSLESVQLVDTQIIDETAIITSMNSYYDNEILNSFIICGKIYFLQYHGSQNTVIRLVFDLYHIKDKFSYLQSIDFIQPYEKNTHLSYNPYDQKIYAWDSEYLITYLIEIVS